MCVFDKQLRQLVEPYWITSQHTGVCTVWAREVGRGVGVVVVGVGGWGWGLAMNPYIAP